MQDLNGALYQAAPSLPRPGSALHQLRKVCGIPPDAVGSHRCKRCRAVTASSACPPAVQTRLQTRQLPGTGGHQSSSSLLSSTPPFRSASHAILAISENLHTEHHHRSVPRCAYTQHVSGNTSKTVILRLCHMASRQQAAIVGIRNALRTSPRGTEHLRLHIGATTTRQQRTSRRAGRPAGTAGH